MPLDASALVELVIDGRHRQGADALLARYAEPRPRVVLVSAAHALVEATSALRRLVLLGMLDSGTSSGAVDWLGRLDLALDPTGPRLPRIWALKDTMSAHDAAYAAMAENTGEPLVTVDQRLLNACRTAGIAAVHLDDISRPRGESPS